METGRGANRAGKFPESNVENSVENVENPWKQWKSRGRTPAAGEKKNVYRELSHNNSNKSKKREICKCGVILQERRRSHWGAAAH